MTEKTARVSDDVTHWIDGRASAGSSGRRGEVFDPATGAVARRVAFASAEDVDAAVAAARAAFAGWRATSLTERSKVLFRFRELLHQRADELAALITSEHGKVVSDARGEVARGLEVVEFACGVPQLLKGGYSEGVSSRLDVYSFRQPLGVVAIVSPFNFPAMVPCWFFPIAIATGNTVVLKPSEKDPSAANWLARLWAEAGLPPGVFNVVHGDKVAVDALLEHPDVEAVSFVGSSPVARHVYECATRAGSGCRRSAGRRTTWWCSPMPTSTSRPTRRSTRGSGRPANAAWRSRSWSRSTRSATNSCRRSRNGSGGSWSATGSTAVDMGPLVTGAHRDRVVSYLDAGLAAGAKLVVDGRDATIAGEASGFWLGPTLFDHVTPDMELYVDEIFGPVLSVVRVDSYDAALALVNANPYGNGTAIFTNDGGAARRFQNEVEVGMIGINVPIPVPVAYYSFGGWKDSLFGDAHAYGPEGVQFFTRAKVVTSRWLDPSHGGLNLGFPENT